MGMSCFLGLFDFKSLYETETPNKCKMHKKTQYRKNTATANQISLTFNAPHRHKEPTSVSRIIPLHYILTIVSFFYEEIAVLFFE